VTQLSISERAQSTRPTIARLLLASIAVAGAWMVLRIAGYRRAKRLFEKFAQTRPVAGEPIDEAAKVKRALDALSRRGFHRFGCLPLALAGWWLLKRRGVESRIEVGVSKNDGSFNSHAWLEVAGQVIVGGDTSPQDYVRLNYDV
jgi:hypothetical protein